MPILFAVTLKASNSLPANIEELVRTAIISAFNGELNGFTRERMASYIFASRYYSVVSAISEYVNILSILIGTTTSDSNSLEMGIDQYPTVSASGIEVTLS